MKASNIFALYFHAPRNAMIKTRSWCYWRNHYL